MSKPRQFRVNGIDYRLVHRPDLSPSRPIAFTIADAYDRQYHHLSAPQAIRLARALEAAARDTTEAG